MTEHVNKDLLIAVMSRQQEELQKMVKLQADQLNNYREHVECFKVLVEKYEQDAAAIEKTVAQYKQLDESQKQKQEQLVEMLDALAKENNKLTVELEELKQYVKQLEQKAQAS